MAYREKQTTYAWNLMNKVQQLLDRRGSPFEIDDLATYAQLPVTGNMRRRLSELVDAGTLEIVYMRGKRGRIRMHYATPDWVRNAEVENAKPTIRDDDGYPHYSR